jgi:hypothetical protein
MNYRIIFFVLLVLCVGLLVFYLVKGPSTSYPLSVQKPEVSPVETETAATDREIARSFVNLLSESKFDQARGFFTSSMKEMLPDQQLKETWQSNVRELGEFEKILEIEEEREESFTLVFITGQFRNSKARIKIIITPEGEITGLAIIPEQQ